MVEIIGFAAGTFTTIAFVPQVLKIHKTKKTEDLSLSMYFIFTLGVSFWLTYGLIIDSRPVIIANIITLILSFYILYMKITESKRLTK
jgi:MtN3 and saliva related transmembrane protein